MRILVVEDNAKLAGHLRRGLAESGYAVDVATDGIDGRHLAIETNYDLAPLDVMLPGAGGFTLLETLRQHKDTPLIMLTAAGPHGAGVHAAVRPAAPSRRSHVAHGAHRSRLGHELRRPQL